MIASQVRHKNLIQLIEKFTLDMGTKIYYWKRLASALNYYTKNVYIAPECYETGKSTKESDVYSYGVVLLEIACGRKPFVPTEDGNWVRLVKWVWDLYGSGKLFEAVDQKLYGDFDREAMKRLMIVGLSCAHPHYQLRPKIGEAMNMLKFIEEPYTLPANFPQSTHPIPSGSLTSSDSSNFSASFEASLIQHRSRARLD
ncbi:hypothetical protein GH714_028772 [Hevea brasiliensis]|uniref:Protein kinase domain-containing protein n=1 Tax=Hevea brasiliensis TaxID=3981 RepID=A0A6A6N332_HEVBR|nr:hypothetical protein GH714_028772 [Hevea brasiliensis]